VAIPYTGEPRLETGLTKAKLGIWVFLASEVMLFGSLFAAYALLRLGAPSWPDQSAVLNVGLALGNTAVLLASSVMLALAVRAVRRGNGGRFRLLMAFSIAAGILFLVVKGLEYKEKFDRGLYPSTNNFLGLYFTMTAVHALHVAGGIVVNAYLWGPGLRMLAHAPARFVSRVEIAGIYWHFVDLMWIALVLVLYLS
jgi:cytochrome c oxidase subunit III